MPADVDTPLARIVTFFASFLSRAFHLHSTHKRVIGCCIRIFLVNPRKFLATSQEKNRPDGFLHFLDILPLTPGMRDLCENRRNFFQQACCLRKYKSADEDSQCENGCVSNYQHQLVDAGSLAEILQNCVATVFQGLFGAQKVFTLVPQASYFTHLHSLFSPSN